MGQSDNARALPTVFAAIDEFNALQPENARLRKEPAEVLLGADSKLDSMGLVSFLVTVEQRVTTDTGTPITLASEKAFSLRNSPFATVQTLAAYIDELLKEAANG